VIDHRSRQRFVRAHAFLKNRLGVVGPLFQNRVFVVTHTLSLWGVGVDVVDALADRTIAPACYPAQQLIITNIYAYSNDGKLLLAIRAGGYY